MPASKSVTLNTGAEMPTLGLGTWKSGPGEVAHAVQFALQNGYTHIDTATAYDNESEVGAGILASGVPRSSFFLTTKLNNNDHKRVKDALDFSLRALKTDYLDLWLMHWPAPMVQDLSGPDRSIDWLDTWKEMVKVYKENPDKVKAIGVSNFCIDYLKRLLADSEVVPAVNQIELHPSCTQEPLVDFCRTHNIVVTAYSPLGSNDSPLLTNPIVNKIAERYGVSPANVLISLQANKPGVNVLSKSVTDARIKANAKVIDLTPEEVQELQDIDKTNHFRVCHPNWTGWGSLGFPDCE
ncbi:Glycerol 2-dehydrogenase (NADP(+)) [Psilocybe cubensis]|uniref:NADP-dependent oxidoreductase domain-containing protein n=2 Tax=Psilocybe cubensis TaxID=181762 RepID=A0A8H7XZ46_PSICU|nr:Glycerol 2-dehydrogenase (NADP(+)) [Psilocybe cubensis]KAH9478655.1 Glycerol 2-dehydrogenase (NADP(+)) [Psilocybe cubensis]